MVWSVLRTIKPLVWEPDQRLLRQNFRPESGLRGIAIAWDGRFNNQKGLFMTNISFKRTGTDREVEYNLDLDTLPGGETQNLYRLIHEADFFNLPEHLGTAGALDETQYTITIGYGDQKQHTVSVN